MWDLKDGRCVCSITDGEDHFVSVGSGLDGKYVLTGSNGGTVSVWETASENRIRTFAGLGGRITLVWMDRQGRLVLSGDSDGTMKFWEFATGRCLKTGKLVASLVWGPPHDARPCNHCAQEVPRPPFAIAIL